jgi:hypothetical protein
LAQEPVEGSVKAGEEQGLMTDTPPATEGDTKAEGVMTALSKMTLETEVGAVARMASDTARASESAKKIPFKLVPLKTGAEDSAAATALAIAAREAASVLEKMTLAALSVLKRA